MRQVPETPKTGVSPRYALLGNGRLATHLRTYFAALKLPFVCWSRCGAPQANTLAEIADPRLRLHQTLKAADVALVLLSDTVIAPFVADCTDITNDHNLTLNWVHCAASVVTKQALCAHPLMTFSYQPYPLATYRNMAFACADPVLFSRLFPMLPNTVFALSPQNQPLYHALCVMAGNFPQVLWQQCQNRFDALDVPREALAVYLRQVLENFLAQPNNALTGPLARGDTASIERNLSTLEDAGHTAQADLYRAFVRLHEQSHTP